MALYDGRRGPFRWLSVSWRRIVIDHPRQRLAVYAAPALGMLKAGEAEALLVVKLAQGASVEGAGACGGVGQAPT
jgi:hypothetical protein